MKYFSSFTGIGGFEIGIRAIDPFAEFVGFSEIDKYAISVYERQFTGVKNYGDITKINASELPDFDCLVGGFPCQAFSIAGKRAGFADTRGTLFFDLARILKEKQPRLFVFENVKGLLSHDKGRTFTTIVAAIDELGYDCQWQVLNSKNHGVPQNRERIIIVGHLRGTSRPQVFPIGESNSWDIAGERDDSKISRTISARFRKGVGNTESRIVDVLVDAGKGERIKSIKDLAETLKIGTYRTHKDGEGFREMQSGISPTIPARAREDGSGQPVVAIPVLTPDRLKKRQNGRRFKEDGEPSFTLNTQDRHGIYNGTQIRRLTPIECERLQAFPDNWTKYGKDGELISDTQRYKMCGNAVTTNVIRDVFDRILA